MAMEFIDKLTASVSKTVKQASDGAKVLADKNRVRKDIATLENELRGLYREIGEQYYEANAENPAPEYAETFQAIADMQASLAEKQRELEVLTGCLTCANCGKNFATDAKFCPYCGEAVPEEQAAAAAAGRKTCAACGAALANDASFCAVCGNQVPADNAAADKPAAKNVCPNCGETLQPDAMFCGVCGTKAPDVE